jgi:hypothetical protein
MKRDRISGILLFAFGLAACLKSLTYPLGDFRRPGGGLFPLIASVFLMGLSVLLTVQSFRAKGGEKEKEAPFFPGKESPRRILMGFAALLGFRYLLPLIGFAPSAAAFIFFLSRFLGRYGWGMSAAFALITAVAAHYLFEVWLIIPMPRNLLGI